jgi:hypothetical protein
VMIILPMKTKGALTIVDHIFFKCLTTSYLIDSVVIYATRPLRILPHESLIYTNIL